MQKYEIKVVIALLTEESRLGEEGWQLVSVIPSPTYSELAVFYFQRPLPLDFGSIPGSAMVSARSTETNDDNPAT